MDNFPISSITKDIVGRSTIWVPKYTFKRICVKYAQVKEDIQNTSVDTRVSLDLLHVYQEAETLYRFKGDSSTRVWGGGLGRVGSKKP